MNEMLKNTIVKSMYTLARLVPKKKNLWLFGAWQAKIYADNSKWLFEYVNKNHADVDAIWLTRNKHLIPMIREKGYKCYHTFSPKGILLALRAGAAFETEGDWDVSPFINKISTKIIMLWHGVGGKSSKWKDKKFGKENTAFKFDYFPATSELYVDIMSESKNVPADSFLITGQARDDTFVFKPKFDIMEIIKAKNPKKTFIIYMPTHRNFGKHKYIINNSFEMLCEVDKMLKKNNMIMVIKPHFHEVKHYDEMSCSFSNIIIAKGSEWDDPYEYLHYFDIMISDYSSCMYDFLCTNRPIVLFTYDINEYIENDANLLESFWQYPIGPMCNSWDEVLNELIKFKEDDDWKDKREVCLQKFHTYNDGNNCERIYQWVQRLLK